MMSPLDYLAGAIVRSCQLDAGSLSLTFEAQTLVVHNTWTVYGMDGKKTDETVLIGSTVTDLQTSDSVLLVKFGSIVLEVDLSASAWSGPEAAVLYVDARPVMAWT